MPSREYFRLPIKSGADLVEQILYSSDESKSAQDNGGVQDQDSGVQDQDSGVKENLGGAPKKKRVVICVPCKKLQYTVSDVQANYVDSQHLFLVTAAFCKDMVAVFSASDVHRRIAELES